MLIYEQFTKYVIYFFNHKSENFYNLNFFLDNDNFDRIINNDRLQDYIDIFIRVNYYNLFYLCDYLTIYNKISKMKNKYIEEVEKYMNIYTLYSWM